MNVYLLNADSFAASVDIICADGAEYQHYAPFDQTFFLTTWGNLIRAGVGVAFGLFDAGRPVGFICGLVMQDLITGMKQGMEQLWYVRPGHRAGSAAIRLLEAFEQEAKKRGAEMILCGCQHQDFGRMQKLYSRRGYAPHAEAFIKRI